MKSRAVLRFVSIVIIALALLLPPTEVEAREGGCQEGGPGSSGCMWLFDPGCAVTCNPGRYACCGEDGCHCWDEL
jgi:hypothetical protein